MGDDAKDSDASPTTGRTGTITLSNNETDLTVDAGFYIPAKLGDYVWQDMNGDGVQDSGEPAIGGVTVNLFEVIAGVPTQIATQQTTIFGTYLFTDLVPSTYIVEFVKPGAAVFTQQDQGDNAKDSDPDTTTGRTVAITLQSGDDDRTWDAGFYIPANLGDKVWLDANVNGIQDAGETAIEGATVELFRTGGTDVIDTRVTNGNGNYYFTNLAPGDYYIKVTPPAGYNFTPVQNEPSDDAKDSDVSPLTGVSGNINLVSGENDYTWDAGLYQPARLGDFVWEDVNANGQQDPGELGIDGVTVTLYKADGTTLISTTTTANGGAYLFDNLLPGDYVVGFEADPKYSHSPQDAGDDATDSDADPTTGKTGVINLANNETDLTVDAGLYIPAKLGDRVWDDLNANGIQDAGEPGIDGVTVNLYKAGDTEHRLRIHADRKRRPLPLREPRPRRLLRRVRQACRHRHHSAGPGGRRRGRL